MTALEPLLDDNELPEISWRASEAIASWRRIVNQTTGDKRPNVERASVELLRLAQAEPSSKQVIVDELADIAEAAGIDPDEAQAIFARAAHASDAAPTIKNLPVAYPLQAFGNISLDTARNNYLVKGLLANSGLAVIWGPPKCGKSFCAPFYLLSTSLDLVAKSGELVTSIKAQLRENLPGVVFLDTLNRSLVGSESRDEDMARYLAAAERVAQELDCAVVIVHHCGIDASRPRGHTSLSGAVESRLKVERISTGEVIVTVELAKDFAEGTEIVSRLERVDLGADPDGDPITSLVVLPVDGPILRRAVTRKLSSRQQLALAALDECAASSGKPAPPNLELPARTIVVQLAAWREELYRKGVLDRNAKSPREEFKRVRNSLQARNLIGMRDELVWKA